MEADDNSLLPPPSVAKIRAILSFLQAMSSEQELHSVPSWKAHQLTGGRKGVWALHITRNWRITFQVDRQEIEIIDLDYEDYH